MTLDRRRARHTLFVQNERFQDMVIIECLVRAARRGVRVHIMARSPHTLKREKLVEGVGGLEESAQFLTIETKRDQKGN